jgi:hypothetical protein
VFVTNAASGAVSGYASREPVATNFVTATATNVVPVFMTNLVQVPVTNLVARPEAEAAIKATGSIINTFAPGSAFEFFWCTGECTFLLAVLLTF